MTDLLKKIPHILLVEDNEQDEVLTIKALKKNRVMNEILVARDGAQALDFLFAESGEHYEKTQGLPPQLILLDLKLPKIDGLEVLKKIRAHQKTKFIPVVILTTSKEDSDIIQGYGNGANSYVRKPVDFKEFTTAVQNLGTYWLLLNEQPPE